MKVLMIDNYDSFTYNLVHLLQANLGEENVTVVRNDHIIMSEVGAFDKVILSPGPGLAKDSGQLMDVIERYKYTKPIFGVCLGYQAIGKSFGAKLINLKKVYHGVATPMELVEDDPLFRGIKSPMMAGRYHSWALEDLPSCLTITAWDENGIAMAFRHRDLPLHGVQFHPESILTPDGPAIIKNWLSL
ncbi:MAG: aminodeoxychorismate/anthranilate synthase component II [Saprospiraceae bacterium]|nr:aminodeoxychorismate/anthranilate synthase component II [Saprospiraceae bacterium]